MASPGDTASHASPDLGLVMGGGGARAVYQVGFLCYLARQFPDLKVPIVTGVSSGGINAALLASHHGSFGQAVGELVSLWKRLTVAEVGAPPNFTAVSLRILRDPHSADRVLQSALLRRGGSDGAGLVCAGSSSSSREGRAALLVAEPAALAGVAKP